MESRMTHPVVVVPAALAALTAYSRAGQVAGAWAG
jgi:hypothetical protein